MPKEIENKLKKEAEKKGFGGERKNRYVYGTLKKKKAAKSMNKRTVYTS